MRYKDNASENNDLEEIAKEIDMTTQTANTAVTISGSAAMQLDDMLEDLDLELETVSSDDVLDDIEEVVVETDDTELAAAEVTDEELENVDMDELEMSLDRAEGYASQESDLTVAEKPAAKPATAAKAPKAPKAPSSPRAPRDMASLDAKVFVLEGDAEAMDDAALDKNKTAVLGNMPSQKKVAEKVENLFASINAGKQPSVYVTAAFKLLDDKKTITGTDVTALLKASYKQGTAQSQSGQIMTLFDTLKIATRQKNTLTLNDNSVVAARLRKIYEDAAA